VEGQGRVGEVGGDQRRAQVLLDDHISAAHTTSKECARDRLVGINESTTGGSDNSIAGDAHSYHAADMQ